MSYETECLLVSLCFFIFFSLALFLGLLISKWFLLFLLGCPIPFVIYGIRYSDF